VPLGEFDLIARYFTRPAARSDVLLGVGDDAALLLPPPGQALAVATDTLVEGRHFLPGTPPDALGHQALAVNLSDLAAMGAEPAWALLSLALPEPDPGWLEAFARGFYGIASAHGVELVGGDTVAGPLVITVQVLGSVPPAQALRRSGARPGDELYVSGWPGVAGAGLERLQAEGASFDDLADERIRRFLRAEPRVALGLALRGVASAAMDVSDGLLGDLGKLVAASGVGVQLELERLPVAAVLERAYVRERCEAFVLEGGDDYELLFTAPVAQRAQVEAAAVRAGCPVHRIGLVVSDPGIAAFRDGTRVELEGRGYDHFAR
jgi:thiamine-monophosphate kinase